MLRRIRFNSEKGVTLVELLAVLTLLGIISIIVYSVGFQGFIGEKKTSNTLALNQEANLMMSELRTQYYNGDSKLCTGLREGLEIKEGSSRVINGANELT